MSKKSEDFLEWVNVIYAHLTVQYLELMRYTHCLKEIYALATVCISCTVLEITFDNRTLSGQYTDKFLFIRKNCPDTREPVKIPLAMVAEACSSKENDGKVGV